MSRYIKRVGKPRSQNVWLRGVLIGSVAGLSAMAFLLLSPAIQARRTDQQALRPIIKSPTNTVQLELLRPQQGFSVGGTGREDRVGGSVSRAGDINNDGIDDFIIGATSMDLETDPPAGAIGYVVFGAQVVRETLALSALDGTNGFAIIGMYSREALTGAMAAAGDINADGIDDLIISAPAADPGGLVDAGETYIVFGKNSSFPSEFELAQLLPSNGGDGSDGFIVSGANQGDRSGVSVSGIGDLNSDGVDDVVIGASFASPNGIDAAGEAYVIFGRNTDFPAIFDVSTLASPLAGEAAQGFIAQGSTPFGASGAQVSRAGDLNNDGIADLIIGSPFAGPDDHEGGGEGHIIFGSPNGFPAVYPLSYLLPSGGGDGSAGFVMRGANPLDALGSAVSDAGDVNGDGIDDLLVGAPFASTLDGNITGSAYVLYGSSQGFPALFDAAQLHATHGADGSLGFVLYGSESHRIGAALAAVGDINSDGRDDLMLGAPTSNLNEPGRSYLIFGQPWFPIESFAAELVAAPQRNGVLYVGAQPGDDTGVAVAGVGDINFDGANDMIVGASNLSAGGTTSAGKAYVVFFNDLLGGGQPCCSGCPWAEWLPPVEVGPPENPDDEQDDDCPPREDILTQ